MNKIALVAIAVSLLSAPLFASVPANAQVDVQVGPRDRDHDRARDRDRHDIVVGEHSQCHIVKIRERHGDHVEIRTERHCD